VRLDPVAILEHEHQVSDVLLIEVIRNLPGVEHDAPVPGAHPHPVHDLDDPAFGVELVPVAGIDHHVPSGTGHPPQPDERLDHRVAAGRVHQRVAGAQHHVEPLLDGGGQVRPQAALDPDRQPFPAEPRRRDPDHRLAPVGRPHAEAPAGQHRRVDAGAAGRVEHGAVRADPLQQARDGGPVDRGSAGQRAVVEYPIVVSREAMVGVSHEAQPARQQRRGIAGRELAADAQVGRRPGVR